MKKLALASGLVGLLSLVAWAGHFTDILPPAAAAGNVPISNGYDWNLSNDSSAPSVSFNSGATFRGSIALYSRTIAQLNALTPSTTGQIAYCSDCVQSAICVSSGIVVGSWVGVAVSTGMTGSYNTIHCQ